MPQVLVRDIDPAVIEKLKARARQNGRSLEGELRQILRQAAEESIKEDIETIQADIARIRALFAGRTFSDSVNLLREDRER